MRDHPPIEEGQESALCTVMNGRQQRIWLREPEKATGPQTAALLTLGFLLIATSTGGIGWLVAEAIKAAGWDG